MNNQIKAPVAATKTITALTVIAKEWFDKANGNSYFSAQITVVFDGGSSTCILVPFEYGYGEAYKYASFKALQDYGLFKKDDENKTVYWKAYGEKYIVTVHTKQEKCLKREVIAHGLGK